MKEYNFHNEIQKNLKMFASAFDDVRIRRFEDNVGYTNDWLKLDFYYGPKSRLLADLKGQTDTIKFPVAAIIPTGFVRDNERIKNTVDEIKYRKPDGSFITLKAVPFNITVEMTIMAKFQTDIDQIIQNFVVHTNPYVVFSWQEPRTGREMRTEVLWDGNINIDYPVDLDHNKSYRFTAKAGFTIKTWLFRSDLSPVGTICKINTDYIFTDKFYCNHDHLLLNTTDSETDSYTISGRPILRYVSPYFIQSGDTPTIKLQGYNFESVESLYVSASNGMYDLTQYDPLSSGNVAFEGLLIDNFNKDYNTLTFTLPSPSGLGFIDIIAVNKCGWGKLTEDANRCNRVENPYKPSNPEHYNWCVLQFPFLNGLITTENHNTLIQDQTCQIISLENSDTLINDKSAIIEKIRELMELGDVSLDDLV